MTKPATQNAGADLLNVRSDTQIDIIKPRETNNPNFRPLSCSRKHHKNENPNKIKKAGLLHRNALYNPKMHYRICDSGSKADDSRPSFLLFAKQFQNLRVSSPAPVTIT